MPKRSSYCVLEAGESEGVVREKVPIQKSGFQSERATEVYTGVHRGIETVEGPMETKKETKKTTRHLRGLLDLNPISLLLGSTY